MELVSLEDAKLWLRVDGDEEDALIQLLIDAAEQYLHDATGRRWTAATRTAKICALALVAEWYENRDQTGEPNRTVRPAIQSMILQLQYTPEDGDDDGSEHRPPPAPD